MVKDNISEGGITLWGQKTLEARPNVLDRVSTRLLLSVTRSILKDGAKTKSRYKYIKALKLKHKFSKKVQRDCLKVFKRATKGRLGTFEDEHTKIVQQYLKTYPKVKIEVLLNVAKLK